MRGCLRLFVPIVILVALALYSALPHPTYEQDKLAAIAAESRRLMADNPIIPVDLPSAEWPPTIASLKPYSVTVKHGMVDITMRPFMDGGWGYGFAPKKHNFTMLIECWSELGHDVYWHGPC